MAQCDIQSLLVDANCFACYPPGILQILKVQLLCEIAAAGGVGGGAIYSGAGSPVGVVTPTQDQAIYFDTATGTQYNWYSGAWH